MPLDSKYRAVCFDMDGTLLDTKPRYDLMTQIIFDEYVALGVPKEIMTEGEKSFNLEEGTKWAIRNKSREEYDAACVRMKPQLLVLEMEGLNGAEEFPGVRELLIELRERGYKTGVLTRGGRAYVNRALEQFDMTRYFDAVVARDDFDEIESKPNPIAMERLGGLLGVRPEEILYMGDHKMDFVCARKAGSGFIAVTSGTHTEEDWHRIDPDIVVHQTVADLKDCI